METYYLAVDIGASSGRLMLAWRQDSKIHLEEVHRFPNGMFRKGGCLCWDLDAVFSEIKAGLRKCLEKGKVPSYMGIDTWGVDFVLLDNDGAPLGDYVGYRDPRTKGMDAVVERAVSREELYRRTGIQKQDFNSIYQLAAIRENQPEILQKAAHFLMIPEYLNYRLTGVMKNEYTNATTTQLVNAQTKDWDRELMERLGLPAEIFGPLSMPGETVGVFCEEVVNEVGYSCTVLLPATHDTGSAVLAVPVEDKALYISSGTWSLIGTEIPEADCRRICMERNLTNEGGYEYRFRFLKNIMGLWMIQSVRKEIAQELSFGQICDMAAQENITSIVDCNDEMFLMPESMTEAVRGYCRSTGQQVPEGIAQIAAVIYHSLAVCYQKATKEIEELTGRTYQEIHVIGGGANASYLNELTAVCTGKTVIAGPGEATAIGNLMVQMIHGGEFANLKEARKAVAVSFPTKKYDKNK